MHVYADVYTRVDATLLSRRLESEAELLSRTAEDGQHQLRLEIARLEQQAADLQSDLKFREEDFKNVQRSALAEAATAKELQDELQHASDKRQAAESALAAAENSRARSAAEAHDLWQQLSAAEQRREAAASSVVELEQQCSSLGRNYTDATSRVERLGKELEAVREKARVGMNQMEQQLAEMTQHTNAAARQIALLQHQLEDEQGRSANATRAATEAGQQLAEAKQAFLKEAEGLKTQVEALALRSPLY